MSTSLPAAAAALPLQFRNSDDTFEVWNPIQSSNRPVLAQPILICSGCCTRHVQCHPALSRASIAADRIQRRNACVVSFKLHFCDILRGIFHASFPPFFSRFFLVAAPLHAVEHVQRPAVRLAQRFKIFFRRKPPYFRHIVRRSHVGAFICSHLVPLGPA